MTTFNPRLKVSSAQLAAVFGVTERRIQQLEEESVLRDVGNGRSKRYVLADAIQACLRKSEIEAARQALGASNSRERYEFERARKLSNENEAREAMMIEMDAVVASLDAIVDIAADEIAKIPDRHSSDPDMQQRLTEAFAVVLRDVHARKERACSRLRAGVDPLAPDESI